MPQNKVFPRKLAFEYVVMIRLYWVDMSPTSLGGYVACIDLLVRLQEDEQGGPRCMRIKELTFCFCIQKKDVLGYTALCQ